MDTTNETTGATAKAEPVKGPTVHRLPLNLGRLAEHTHESGHYGGISAVRVAFDTDGTFLAEATDAKVLVQVRGVCPDNGPEIPALAHAPNGEVGALVPAASWKKAFVGARKVKRSGSLAVVTGKDVTTLAASNGTDTTCDTAQNAEGRFPPTADILTRAKAENTHFAVAVCPKLLGELLRTLAEFTTDDIGVTLSFSANKNKPILFTVSNAKGEAAAVLMPLAR